MRVKEIMTAIAALLSLSSAGQELYIFTDPASNMPAKVLNLRLTNTVMPMNYDSRNAYRLGPEVGVGITKNWQAKLYGYAANMMQPSFKFEGVGLSTKYRFLSVDDFHKHFRMAAYGKASLIGSNAYMETKTVHQRPDGEHVAVTRHYADEIAIDGNHSGMQAGIVATQLVNKFAVSANLSYLNRWNNPGDNGEFPDGLARHGLQYSLSAGLLVFPKNYENYKQTNFNVYLELIGSSLLDEPGSYLDMAPGVQFIFNSTSRVDLAYRFQTSSSMKRYSNEQFLLRYEYNFLNMFKGNNTRKK